MNVIHAGTALLPEGWARDVVVTLDGGRIASVAAGGITLPSLGPGTAPPAGRIEPGTARSTRASTES